MEDAYVARVRSWAAQLRSGSTDTWAEASGKPAVEGLSTTVLPGAAQLEVVRRLPRGLPGFERLADLVLATPGAGRGLVDPPVPDPEAPEFGSPAAPPEELSAEELLRVCAPVLVALLAGLDLPEEPARRGHRRPWRRRRFVVLGAPATAAAVRAALREKGLREGGRHATYVVVGGPLEELMAQRWSARVRAGAGLRWSRLWRLAESGDRVPPGIDLPGLARRLAAQAGPDRVHVVLGEDPATVGARVAPLLGLSSLPLAVRPDPLATDLLRRINPLLILAVGEERRRVLVDRVLVDRVWARIGVESPSWPGIPRARRPWADAAGTRLAERLRHAALAGDYAVHGDPPIVVPGAEAGRRGVLRSEAVLEFALEAIGRVWTMSEEEAHR